MTARGEERLITAFWEPGRERDREREGATAFRNTSCDKGASAGTRTHARGGGAALHAPANVTRSPHRDTATPGARGCRCRAGREGASRREGVSPLQPSLQREKAPGPGSRPVPLPPGDARSRRAPNNSSAEQKLPG